MFNMRLNQIISSLMLFGIILFNGFYLSITTTAAGLNITLSPSTVSTSTAFGFLATFTSSSIITTAGYIDLFYPSTYTGTMTTLNTNLNGSPAGSVTNSTIGSEIRARIVPTSTLAAGVLNISTSVLTSPATAGNYAFRITTSTNDFGATLQYVGQANQVQIRSLVRATLSFSIRNTADNANTNLCDMGTLSTTTVSTCSYRLKTATNATNGYSISVNTSGNLVSGAKSFANAAVGTGGAGGTNIVAGTERYGAVITKGAVTTVGGTTTLGNAYNAGVTNSVSYVNTSAATLLTANKPNNPAASADLTNTALITHRAAISQNTSAGVYTQNVTYTVTPSY